MLAEAAEAFLAPAVQFMQAVQVVVVLQLPGLEPLQLTVLQTRVVVAVAGRRIALQLLPIPEQQADLA